MKRNSGGSRWRGGCETLCRGPAGQRRAGLPEPPGRRGSRIYGGDDAEDESPSRTSAFVCLTFSVSSVHTRCPDQREGQSQETQRCPSGLRAAGPGELLGSEQDAETLVGIMSERLLRDTEMRSSHFMKIHTAEQDKPTCKKRARSVGMSSPHQSPGHSYGTRGCPSRQETASAQSSAHEDLSAREWHLLLRVNSLNRRVRKESLLP